MHPKCRYRLWGAFFNTLLSLLIYKIVDENIRLMTKQNQYLPPDRVAVLTALQIAEQLIRLKKDYNEFWDILDENRSNKHK